MNDDGGSDVLASYVYNGRGERAIKRLGREGERATWYVYDLSGHLIAELRAHGGRGRVQDEYVYGPSGRLATIAVHGDDGRGKADRRHRGGDDASESVYWHINDHLGTPQALTDRRGRVVWAADYLPFGGIVSPRHGDGDRSGHGMGRGRRHWKVVNNFRFPGQYHDAETGLNYNVNRDYDPSMGRYIESDPTGLKGGINSYAYALGNPLRYIDLSGLDVTIFIGNRTYSPTGSSVEGTINVTSDQTQATFSGYTMENAHAGIHGNKNPVPAGIYNAKVRTDHMPNRVELQNVPGYSSIEIHNGSFPRNFKGCFGAGTYHSTDFLGNTIKALNKINNIIRLDGTGNITVIVGPIK